MANTMRQSNVAMQNAFFMDVVPTKTTIYKGFSIATFNVSVPGGILFTHIGMGQNLSFPWWKFLHSPAMA